MTACSPAPSSILPAGRSVSANRWADYLARPADAQAPQAPLTLAEAERVRRHHDRLLAALHARDRAALHGAKQQVLSEAFAPADAQPPGSPALRRALRELSWRMAGMLLPRRPSHAAPGGMLE